MPFWTRKRHGVYFEKYFYAQGIKFIFDSLLRSNWGEIFAFKKDITHEKLNDIWNRPKKGVKPASIVFSIHMHNSLSETEKRSLWKLNYVSKKVIQKLKYTNFFHLERIF